MGAHLLLVPRRFCCTAAAAADAPCDVLAAATVLLTRGLRARSSSSSSRNSSSNSSSPRNVPLPLPHASVAQLQAGCTPTCTQPRQQQPHHHHQWQQHDAMLQLRWLPQQHRQEPRVQVQHHNTQQLRSFHDQRRLQQPSRQGSTTQAAAAAAAAGTRLPGAAFTTLPNLLSLSRVAMGPWLAFAVTSQQWPVAVALTAAAGATDWLDGYLARRLGHTSKLGSYLDPLADKVFVATAVGTLGYMGMVPAWLAVVVVGRDSMQVVGMFWYRLRMFDGAWPGAAAFFDVDHGATPRRSPSSGSGGSSSSSSGSDTGSTALGGDNSSSSEAAGTAGEQGGLPMIKPLLISKANTALVMALVAGCMGNQWQGLPGQEVLNVLELVTAATTLSSAAAYAHLHWRGKLLAGN